MPGNFLPLYAVGQTVDVTLGDDATIRGTIVRCFYHYWLGWLYRLEISGIPGTVRVTEAEIQRASRSAIIH